NKRGSEVQKDQEHGNGRGDDGFEKRAGNRADRALDELCTVVHANDAYSLGQADLQLLDLVLDAARDFERVFAEAHQHHAADNLVAVLLKNAAAKARPECHMGQVAELQESLARHGQNDILQIVYSLFGIEGAAVGDTGPEPANAADEVLAVGLL